MKRLLLIFALLSIPCFASPAFVRGGYCVQSGGTCTVALASVGSGDSIVAAIEYFSTTATFTVTDDGGNSYSQAVLKTSASGYELVLFYALGCNASAGAVTITIHPSDGGVNTTRLAVGEYSGTATAAALDGTGSDSQASGATITTGAFAATSGDLIVAFGLSEGGTIATGAGYTAREGDTVVSLEDQILSGGTATATFTQTSAGWTIVALALKPVATGASTNLVISGHVVISGAVVLK